jgi:outer membrane lipoprotein-sorting protein
MRLALVLVYPSILLAACLAGGAPAAEADESAELEKALARVDQVSRTFRSFSARLSQKKYTAVLAEFDTPEKGRFHYAVARDGSVMMRHEIEAPGKRILTIKGDSAVLYQPVVRQAQVYALGKRKNLVEYLGTGLGQSSENLRGKFHIAWKGSASIDGRKCFVLEFKPRDPKAAASVRSITVSFDQTNVTPVRYRIEEPSGDYLLETFSEGKLNTRLPDDLFEQKLPKGVEVLKF